MFLVPIEPDALTKVYCNIIHPIACDSSVMLRLSCVKPHQYRTHSFLNPLIQSRRRNQDFFINSSYCCLLYTSDAADE